jgi:hypothetical protein
MRGLVIWVLCTFMTSCAVYGLIVGLAHLTRTFSEVLDGNKDTLEP